MRRIGTIAFLIVAVLIALGARHGAWGEEAGAPKAAGATCDRAAFGLVLDVGHTAQVPGAKSARGALEFDFNLRLAKLIEQQLIEAGFAKTVLLVTEGPALAGLARRVARANAAHADLLLSIHHDSVPDSMLEKWDYNGEPHIFSDRFKGHSLFVSYENRDRKDSLRFARLLGLALKSRGLQYTPHYTDKIMGHRRRELIDAEAGVYRFDRLVVLKYPQMPAVLLEAGSIINRDEELLMGTPEHQAVIAAAVVEAAEGFCRERKPVKPDRIARPDAGAKAKLRPAAVRGPAGNAIKR
ncbi:MAG: N-acetylmuramoyl-L-alanine amidase [Hyphomicrobiales bacterium]|nr:N-acetylmuramoyl-L-alanine amidase [Hyphomicrobiales bacterium]MBV8826161.1 N-acetylmuramoyl-L-alanine amidase [Hyphomicrobiales bacterium]